MRTSTAKPVYAVSRLPLWALLFAVAGLVAPVWASASTATAVSVASVSGTSASVSGLPAGTTAYDFVA
ncbi:MAG TPA: hypothetical protein PLU83_11795, partial [Phycicoccus sp.]|nr:hypothetical protein [Phycicoccus sp.]